MVNASNNRVLATDSKVNVANENKRTSVEPKTAPDILGSVHNNISLTLQQKKKKLIIKSLIWILIK